MSNALSKSPIKINLFGIFSLGHAKLRAIALVVLLSPGKGWSELEVKGEIGEVLVLAFEKILIWNCSSL